MHPETEKASQSTTHNHHNATSHKIPYLSMIGAKIVHGTNTLKHLRNMASDSHDV